MQTAISAPNGAGQVVGKKELCAQLGWTRPKLDRRLDSDPNFPVRRRGSATGGWEFDIAAVDAYLTGGVLSRTEEPPPAAAVNIEAQPLAREHAAEATARQRRDTVQAQLLEDRLRRQRGELVEAEPLKLKLATAVTKLSSGLNSLPDVLARRLQLPEAAAAVVRQEIEDARRAFFAELRDLLTDG